MDDSPTSDDRFAGLVVKASASRAGDPGSILACAVGIFPGRVTPVTQKSGDRWLPCQEPGDTGPALLVVGPVSEYSEW